MKKALLVVSLSVGMALAFTQIIQRGEGKTQIANSKIDTTTSVGSSSVRGNGNQVSVGKIKLKGTQIANSRLKSTTIVNRQKVEGDNNKVDIGGIETE